VNVLAVCAYTGDLELCKMTERMLEGLYATQAVDVTLHVSVTAQGAVLTHFDEVTSVFPENHSFARGINTAIRMGMSTDPDYILVLNNDLEFTYGGWMKELVRAASQDRVCVPATNRAAIRTQTGPVALQSLAVDEMSAYCWLVPAEWSRFLLRTYGFEMFCEDFVPGYGEDNWTAYLLTKEFGPKVFRYVRRSWVKHLRHQTSSKVPHDRSVTSEILKEKFIQELRHTNLRVDLRVWAQRMVQVLK
jgi:hypothetical protein